MFKYIYNDTTWYINIDQIVRMRVYASNDMGYLTQIELFNNEGCVFWFSTKEEAEKLAENIVAMHSAMFDARVGIPWELR